MKKFKNIRTMDGFKRESVTIKPVTTKDGIVVTFKNDNYVTPEEVLIRKLDKGLSKEYKIEKALWDAIGFVRHFADTVYPVRDPYKFADEVTMVGNFIFPTMINKIALRAILNATNFVTSEDIVNAYDVFTPLVVDLLINEEDIKNAKKEVRKNRRPHLNIINCDDTNDDYDWDWED